MQVVPGPQAAQLAPQVPQPPESASAKLVIRKEQAKARSRPNESFTLVFLRVFSICYLNEAMIRSILFGSKNFFYFFYC